MLTIGSLFSGIGGLDLGLERAGMRVLWQVENNAYCNRVLEQHWPAVARYGDVRDVGRHNLEPVDLICGGFPCQPHSLAGKRKGKEDERNLWPEYLRIVDELRPTWVLGENVPGIRTTILDDILDDLEGLDYATRTFDIPACAVGAPHLRHRFFIVAYCNSRDAPDGSKRADVSGEDRGRRDDGAGSQCDSWQECMGSAGQGACALAHATQQRLVRERGNIDGTGRAELWAQQEWHQPDSGNHRRSQPRTDAPLAHADCPRCQEQRRAEPVEAQQRSVECGGAEMAHADGRRCEQCHTTERGVPEPDASSWQVEPNVGRVAHGIPSRVDRLRCLGNAVVPQVAEYIGRLIVAAHQEE